MGMVLGDREKGAGTYREFVFFNEDSVYPEYVVFYRREYAKLQEAPEPMRWMWFKDNAWHLFDREAVQDLTLKFLNGAAYHKFHVAGQVYQIDFERLVQRNIRTGKERRVSYQRYPRPSFEAVTVVPHDGDVEE